ncbi:hypothetical protein [Neoroseomonas soli]|uniref:Uncharacterized protein n=1 Tax=Neoroseomonas soli TaxID=1081025 RepID=A0A9X9X045_9PROT|nr:hypothetical protein [Neoroseomonas soli]MBR0672774.1 hypothetical protein [Neoroseomonas soli]
MRRLGVPLEVLGAVILVAAMLTGAFGTGATIAAFAALVLGGFVAGGRTWLETEAGPSGGNGDGDGGGGK